MGGDIHLCSLVLSNGATILLYVVSLLGSFLSILASLSNIFFYLYKKKRPFSFSSKLNFIASNYQITETKPLYSPNSVSDVECNSPNSRNSNNSNSPNSNSNNNNGSSPSSNIQRKKYYRYGSNNHHDTDNDNGERVKPKMINQLVFYLSIADLIACLALGFSQIFIMFKLEFVETITFCITARSIIHFGFLASFLWTNIIAYFLLRETFDWHPYNGSMAMFHIIGWGGAAMCVGSLFIRKYFTEDVQTGWCAISSTYQLYFWVLPLLVSFLWNLICYILIYRKFKSVLSYGAFGSNSVQLKRYIAKKLTFYLLAFLLSWVWDLINHTVFYIRNECPPFFLWVLQDLFSPSQGFLNFLVYAFTNRSK